MSGGTVVERPQAVMDQSVPVTNSPTVAVWSSAARIAHSSDRDTQRDDQDPRPHAIYGAAGRPAVLPSPRPRLTVPYRPTVASLCVRR